MGKSGDKDLTTIGQYSHEVSESTSEQPAEQSSAFTEPSVIEQVDDFGPLEHSLEHPQDTPDDSLTHGAIDVQMDALLSSPEFQPEAPPIDNTSNDPLAPIKEYAEQTPASKVSIPAAYPFSLSITGPLTPEEKEKLLDLLARENMGIREVDLEPQLESDRILIPRISEYAGVLLVQALRGTRAQMRLAPSDEEVGSIREVGSTFKTTAVNADFDHPAERIPVTPATSLPEATNYSVIGVITATAALHSSVVEMENSSEYLEILEALQRELKYKAYYKNAIAILNYSVQLTTLQLPSHYRVMVSGTAIK